MAEGETVIRFLMVLLLGCLIVGCSGQDPAVAVQESDNLEKSLADLAMAQPEVVAITGEVSPGDAQAALHAIDQFTDEIVEHDGAFPVEVRGKKGTAFILVRPFNDDQIDYIMLLESKQD